jgi:predicted transcriptional regulator
LDKAKLKNYAKLGKAIAADFKKLQKTIKKNLADMQSEQSDVDMVNEMIERVQKHEDIFDNMNDPEKEKVQKMRNTIKSKVETELQKMKREVNSLLKVNSMNSSNMMDNLTEMMDRVNSMMSNL